MRVAAYGALCSVALASLQAHAYLPPSQFIVMEMARRHAGVKTLRVRSTVTAFEAERATTLKFKQVFIYSAENGTLKSWALDENDRVLGSVDRRVGTWGVVDRLLLSEQGAPLGQVLKKLDIPIKSDDEILRYGTEKERRDADTTQLARWNGQAAWVIGVTSDSGPALWVKKDLFQVHRLIFDRASDGARTEIRFDNYSRTRQSSDFFYPRQIRALKRGVSVFQEDVIDIALDGDDRAMKSPSGEKLEPGQSMKDLIGEYFSTLR